MKYPIDWNYLLLQLIGNSDRKIFNMLVISCMLLLEYTVQLATPPSQNINIRFTSVLSKQAKT